METVGEWIDLPGDGAPMATYRASPREEGRYPAIIMFAPIVGMNEEQQRIANVFASNGYTVLAPDLYHRIGYRTVWDYPAQAEECFRAAASVMDCQAMADSRSVMDYIKAQPGIAADRVGVIGFCFGGRVAFLAACTSADFKAAVVAYPLGLHFEPRTVQKPVGVVDLLDGLRCPVLCLSGSIDDNPSPADVEVTASAMKRAGKSFEFEVYQGAGHGFFSQNRAEFFHPQAAEKGWSRNLAFFGQHLDG